MFKIKVLFLIILSPIMLILGLSTLGMGLTYDNTNIQYQENHLAYLKSEYYTDSYMPCDEQKLADFNIEQAYSDGTKLNELAVIGTHNSYQTHAYFSKRALETIVYYGVFGVKYNNVSFEMDTLTQQLEHGVRKLELDIETVDDGEISFIVTHDPIVDNVTSCYDFSKALEEIAMWSDSNPNHLPIYLLIEPKNYVLQIKNMKNFSLKYALELDNVLKNVLGDRLLTPAIAMGEYASLAEMRSADNWPTLKDCAGKIIVLLHPGDVTDAYIETDTTIKTQAMFPMLRMGDIDKTYASFIIDNDPYVAANNKEIAQEKKLIVRTRADSYPNFDDERYVATDSCGAQIVTTDYPPRTVREVQHTYTFNGYMFKLIK